MYEVVNLKEKKNLFDKFLESRIGKISNKFIKRFTKKIGIKNFGGLSSASFGAAVGASVGGFGSAVGGVAGFILFESIYEHYRDEVKEILDKIPEDIPSGFYDTYKSHKIKNFDFSNDAVKVIKIKEIKKSGRRVLEYNENIFDSIIGIEDTNEGQYIMINPSNNQEKRFDRKDLLEHFHKFTKKANKDSKVNKVKNILNEGKDKMKDGIKKMKWVKRKRNKIGDIAKATWAEL